MALSQDMVDLIDERIAAQLTRTTTAATVVQRTGTTTAMVTLDGSAMPVPVKVFGDVSLAEGDRVGLVRLGVDWTIVGTFIRRQTLTWPMDAVTGQHRIVAGADTPPELQAYGILEAVLFYVTDKASPFAELGYFFIGQSNSMDGGANQKVLLFGNVAYPVAGRPSSATITDVKTNHQINLWGTNSPGTGFTVFKDSMIQVNNTVPQFQLGNPDTFFQGSFVQFNGTVIAYFNSGGLLRLDSGSQFLGTAGSNTNWDNGANWQRRNGGNVAFSGDPGKGILNWTYTNAASANTVAGAPFSAKIICLTIANHAFESGRCYAIDMWGGFNSNTAACSGNFFLHKGNVAGAGTVLWDWLWGPQAQGQVRTPPPGTAWVRRTAAGILYTDISLQLGTDSSATGRHYADGSHNRGMMITDVGTAADYPFAFDIT